MSPVARIRKQSRCHETIPSAHILNPIVIVNSRSSRENDNRQTRKNAGHCTAARRVCFSAPIYRDGVDSLRRAASHTTSARQLPPRGQSKLAARRYRECMRDIPLVTGTWGISIAVLGLNNTGCFSIEKQTSENLRQITLSFRELRTKLLASLWHVSCTCPNRRAGNHR